MFLFLQDKICHYHYHCVCLCYRKDAFTGAEYIQEGLQIEQASVLYNLCESTSLHVGYREEGRKEGGREGKRSEGRREEGGREGKRREGREGKREGGRREGLNHVLITNYSEVHERKTKVHVTWGVGGEESRGKSRDQCTDSCNVFLQVPFIHNLVVMAGETQSR